MSSPSAKPDLAVAPGRTEQAVAPRPREPRSSGSPARRSVLRDFFRRPVRARRFLAFVPERDELAALLECMYTARLIRRRHEGVETAIVVHPDNARFVTQGNLFDQVIEECDPARARQIITESEADILYVPGRDLRSHITAFLSGARIRVGGARLRLLSRLFRTHAIHQRGDLEKLRKKGFDLFPEITSLRMSGDLALSPRVELPGQPFVWLSLFDHHDLNNTWPPGHVARLARLLTELKLRLVCPAPASIAENPAPGAPRDAQVELWREQRDYILRSAPDVVFLYGLCPEERAAGMKRAQAVVSPAGPETILASLYRKPVVVLHDMKTFRNHPGHVRPPGLHDESPVKPARRALGHPGNALELLSAPGFPLTSYIIKLANSLEKHIKPAVDHCNNSCPTCEFQSCVEFISPERVYETLKRALLPF
ncbi:MAG: hypothetical protein H7A21_17215 [Spirochaetales bacterium]|nr:hypothetical protein [Leptospiraceae bacterium]MCP5483181.1 hypothetical protein [Spirochaetales bacterium]MCP5486685.1 hypothetical protein [Spirochaetales bacterium]